ncbi:hypothetical protein Tco_0567377 [Tanacetum coccineum]
MKLNPKKCSFEMEDGKILGCIVTSEGIRANPEKTKVVMDMPSPSSLKQMHSLSGNLAKAAERAIPCPDTLKKCTNKKDFRWTKAVEDAFQAMKKLIGELPNVLWAHKTMLKTSNEETPFNLAYGTEVVIPAKVGMPTRRIA